jgi:uncharacterized protein (DUF58 family)
MNACCFTAFQYRMTPRTVVVTMTIVPNPRRTITFNLPPFSPSKDIGAHPLLRGSISRWLWRLFTQRLTPAGRWLLLPTAAFSFYGGASLQMQGYVAATYMSALWAVAFCAMLLYRPRVKLHFTHADRVCAGEALPVDVEVRQLGAGRGADLVVVPHRLPLGIDAEPDQGMPLGDLRRGESARVRLTLRCNKRGAYTLAGFRVETGFPFGILRAQRLFAERKALLVYPKFTALGRLMLPTGMRYQPGGVALASTLGESMEFIGNREYRQGDNIRDIDWRATARTGGAGLMPIVREYRDEYFMRVAVILDTHVPEGPTAAREADREAFERAVSVAAAVSDYMARQDYLVDLFAAGPNLYHLTAGRSLAYLDQILDILACVEENPQEPFETIEPEISENLAQISTVICVFLDWNETRQAFVHRLAQQGAGVKVILVRDKPATVHPGGEADMVGEIPVIGKAEFERGMEEI